MKGRYKYYISKEWLERQLQQYTVRQMESLFGISKSTIALTCKRYGITNPRPASIQPGEYARAISRIAQEKRRRLHATKTSTL